jgi:hypothetical protein
MNIAHCKFIPTRVARWYIFKPKIPILVILDVLGMENVGTYLLCPLRIYMYNGHLVYFMAIW